MSQRIPIHPWCPILVGDCAFRKRFRFATPFRRVNPGKIPFDLFSPRRLLFDEEHRSVQPEKKGAASRQMSATLAAWPAETGTLKSHQESSSISAVQELCFCLAVHSTCALVSYHLLPSLSAAVFYAFYLEKQPFINSSFMPLSWKTVVTKQLWRCDDSLFLVTLIITVCYLLLANAKQVISTIMINM